MPKFYIKKFDGMLGNQILTYNNICQLAYINNKNIDSVYVVKSEIDKYFKNIKTTAILDINGKEINGNIIRNNRSARKIIVDTILTAPFMGNLFFQLTNIDPRNFLELKDAYKINITNDKTNIALHLRVPGTSPNKYKQKKHSFFEDLNYFKRAIIYCTENISNYNFIIFGASSPKHFICQGEERSMENAKIMANFPLYNDIIDFMNNNNYTYEKSLTLQNPDLEYIFDFSQMCDCDIIIGTPSTFSTCAVFLGKKDKRLIYNKDHLKFAVDNRDEFWVDLSKGKNKYCNISVLI